MNFIGRHIEAVGLILLLSFATAAATIYFEVPKRLQNASVIRPAAAQASEAGCADHSTGCCSKKEAQAPAKAGTGACPHADGDH